MWNKFQYYQIFRNKAPVFRVGKSAVSAAKFYQNPVKVALNYNEMFDLAQADSQADLARILGVSRAKVTQMMNLLKLDEEIQAFMLGLKETDERLLALTERRLRPLTRISDRNSQREHFRKLLAACRLRAFSQSSSAQNDGQKQTPHESPTAS